MSEIKIHLACAWLNQTIKSRLERGVHVSHTADDMLHEANKKFELDFCCGTEGWNLGVRSGVNYLSGGDEYVLTIIALSNGNHCSFVACSLDDIKDTPWANSNAESL
jgi:hypothetical protein